MLRKSTSFSGAYFCYGDIDIPYKRLTKILKKGDSIYGFSKKLCHYEWLTITHVDWWGVYAVTPTYKGHLKIKWCHMGGIRLGEE